MILVHVRVQYIDLPLDKLVLLDYLITEVVVREVLKAQLDLGFVVVTVLNFFCKVYNLLAIKLTC